MSLKLADVSKEYEKDNKLKKEDVKMMREWLEKQPHLPEVAELQLILFLNSCYYRIEAAKTTLDNFFTLRSQSPDIFNRADEKTVRKNLGVGLMAVLPELSPEGDTVYLGKLLDKDPEQYNTLEQIKVNDMVQMLHLHQHGASNGLITILDMEGFTFAHLTKINLSVSKRHIHFIQEGLPMRLKQIHVINTVSFIDKLMAIVKPFMKKDMIDLIHFHTAPNETLYKFVPKRLLPKDMGGEAPTVTELQELSIQKIMENPDFFKWLDSQKVDEKKRQGKSKNAGTSFGADGSFKKIELD